MSAGLKMGYAVAVVALVAVMPLAPAAQQGEAAKPAPAGQSAGEGGAAAGAGAAGAAKGAAPAAASSHVVTPEQYARWKKELSNWGRWGKDDEIGTMNLVTPAKRKQAAALVKEGFSVSLAHDPDTVKSIDNPAPYDHKMTGIALDQWGVFYHGVAHTHLDSLAHVNEDGVFYNGYKPDPAAIKEAGHHFKNSIHNLKSGIFTRAVLIDIPRLKGVPYLEPSTPIYVEDLEAWEKKAGVKVGPGDVLLVRTGVWAKRKAVGPYERGRKGTDPGLDASVLPWLRKRDIAVLGTESPAYVSPSPIEGATGPVHDFALVYLGVHLIDNVDLDALSEAAAARNRWEFLLTMAPVPIVGGTGSPINPIVTF